MTEMHLRQPELTYSACGSFTKSKEGIRKRKETEDSECIYQNELVKACFQHDMVCGDFKDLSRRTGSDKILHDKIFNITKIRNTVDIKGVFLKWHINFLIKNHLVVALKMQYVRPAISKRIAQTNY